MQRAAAPFRCSTKHRNLPDSLHTHAVHFFQYNQVVNQMADVEKAQEGTGPGVYAAARFCLPTYLEDGLLDQPEPSVAGRVPFW